MISNLGKKIPAALALAATSVAFGAMSTNERVAQLEQQMQCVYLNSINETCGAQTASARPTVKGDCRCGMGWFAEFDVLYWHPTVGGTEFAYSDNSPTLTIQPNITTTNGFPLKGRVKDIDFSWDWGFKAALGYNFEHDAWDAKLEYTRFHTNGGESSSAGQNSCMVPLKGTSSITNGDGGGPQPTGTFLYSGSAKSQFDLDYDRLDLDLGRNFFVSKYLALRPNLGLTAAWFEVDQTTRYTGGATNGTNLGLDVNTVSVKDECEFAGLGPMVSIETKWSLGENFSIIGNFGTAAVYGHFDVTHKEQYSLIERNRIDIRGDENRFVTNTNYQLGLAYDTYLNDDQQHLCIFIAYEVQQWLRLNQSLEASDFTALRFERVSEDVSYQGVTFGARLDF